ncbi:MAG: LysR family transcriptional regulator [Selenomonadaceae bacterium]|nr:LysR family transcriptional regulator [Selenomonadaceae bacterium]
MTEAEIKAFLTVVNAGNVTEAARELYLTQPALSRRLHALEQSLGYSLLTRGKGLRNVELTPEGKSFIPLAEKWLRLFAESKELPRQMEQVHNFNLGLTESICIGLLPDILKQFIRENPLCHLNIHQYHSEDCYRQMESGALNFAFVGKEMFSRQLKAEPVYRSPFRLVSSVPLPEDVRHPSCLPCDKELFVPWNTEFQLWHDYWFGTALRPRVWLNIMPPLSGLLQEEGAWSVVPEYIARYLCQSHSFYVYDLQEAPNPITLFALYHKEKIHRYGEIILALWKRNATGLQDVK